MRPQSGVAAVQADEGVLGQEPGELGGQPRGVDWRPVELEAAVGHHGHDALCPRGLLARPTAVVAQGRCTDGLGQGAQALAGVADEGDVDGSVHADDQRVTIDVHEALGARPAPGGELAVADDLADTGADGDDDIGLLHHL